MNIEEAMMPIDEWNKQFSCKRMQQPISFLTEEDLNKLEQHCEKTIKYGNGRILEEHQVTLELIIRYRELKQELEKEKEKNKEAKNLLIDMVNQFAYEDNNPKTRGSSEQKIYTAGLSTLEDAFYLLDIDEGIKREDLWKLKEE